MLCPASEMAFRCTSCSHTGTPSRQGELPGIPACLMLLHLSESQGAAAALGAIISQGKASPSIFQLEAFLQARENLWN